MQISTCDPVIAPTCNIRFDGPFVLAFTQDYSDSTNVNEIVAFVPRDPMRECMPRHYLFVDRKLVGCDDGSQFDFTVVKDDQGYCGIKVNDCPTKVDPRFNDFRVQLPCKCDDYFVKVSIPRPKSIWLSEKPVNVTFEDCSHGLMPLNHICEYDVDPLNKGIALTSKETDRLCLDSDSPLLFQVGISQFGNMSEKHALHFYNDVISACFPPGSFKCLEDIESRNLNNTGTMRPMSLDVDCKLGGVIGG